MEGLIKNENTSRKSVIENFVEGRAYLYPVLMYLAGLLVGVVAFKCSNEGLKEAAKEIFSISETTLSKQLINHFCLYFSIYSLTVLLGLCLVGFPVLYSIPLIIGIEAALKLSYLYTTYSAKGIGYSLLMIVPECSVFVTVLILAIVKSNSLSKSIFNLISKNSDTTKNLNLKSYLNAFLIYALVVAGVSMLNSVFNYLLSTIISI